MCVCYLGSFKRLFAALTIPVNSKTILMTLGTGKPYITAILLNLMYGVVGYFRRSIYCHPIMTKIEAFKRKGQNRSCPSISALIACSPHLLPSAIGV